MICVGVLFFSVTGDGSVDEKSDPACAYKWLI